MIFSIVFLIIICSLIGFILFFAIKYRNPHKLVMVFGKKGSGKTTLITKLSQKYIKKGVKVYSSVYIPGTYYFDPADIGFYNFEPNSVIFIDEVGMIWDNRNFKSFCAEVRDYFKLQRHYKHTVYLFSQAFDIDKKLRDLTDQMYLVKCYFNCLSVCRKINKNVGLVQASAEAESRIVDNLEFAPLFAFWQSPFILTWIPAWTKYFDSFDVPELKPKSYSLVEYPENFEELTFKFRFVNCIHDKFESFTNRALGVYMRLHHRRFH